jgi:hypothetical protein
MGDAALRSIHEIGQTTPGLDIYIEAVLLFASALVSYASELNSPRHVTFVTTSSRNPRETVQWTSRRTAQRAMVTTATVFHHPHTML